MKLGFEDSMGMSNERGVHPDCINASNPYHECVDYCFNKIAESKLRSVNGDNIGNDSYLRLLLFLTYVVLIVVLECDFLLCCFVYS